MAYLVESDTAQETESIQSVYLQDHKNLSLKRYEYHHAKKRNSQYDLSLEELEECISKEQNVENQIELRELKWIIAKFIEELPKEKEFYF